MALDIASVLLALLTVGVTINIAILGFLLTRLLRMEPKIQTLMQAFFGREADGKGGITHQVDALEDQLTELDQRRAEEHEQVEQKLDNLDYRNRRVLEALNNSDKVDLSIDVSNVGNSRNSHND